jgi:hypothetical protein
MRRLLHEILRNNAGMILGSFDSDGTLNAATALVWDQSNVYYFLTTRQATAHSGAVALLIWQAMKVARDRKLELDFDGVSTAGILQFLAGFGGQLVRRYTFEKTRSDVALVRTVRASSRDLAKRVRGMVAKKSAPEEEKPAENEKPAGKEKSAGKDKPAGKEKPAVKEKPAEIEKSTEK